MVKGQKVLLPYHDCEGIVNLVTETEVCIKYGENNVWVTPDGRLPNTKLQIVCIPKFKENDIVTVTTPEKYIYFGKILKVCRISTSETYYSVEMLSGSNRDRNCHHTIKEKQITLFNPKNYE